MLSCKPNQTQTKPTRSDQRSVSAQASPPPRSSSTVMETPKRGEDVVQPVLWSRPKHTVCDAVGCSPFDMVILPTAAASARPY